MKESKSKSQGNSTAEEMELKKEMELLKRELKKYKNQYNSAKKNKGQYGGS